MNRGFTLIETLVGMIVVTLLVVMMFVFIGNIASSSKAKSHAAQITRDMQAVVDANTLYKLENGKYPATNPDLFAFMDEKPGLPSYPTPPAGSGGMGVYGHGGHGGDWGGPSATDEKFILHNGTTKAICVEFNKMHNPGWPFGDHYNYREEGATWAPLSSYVKAHCSYDSMFDNYDIYMLTQFN